MIRCKKHTPKLYTSLLSWDELFLFYLWNIWLTRNHNHHNDHKILIPIPTTFERAIEFYYLTTNNHPAINIPRKTWVLPDKGLNLILMGLLTISQKLVEPMDVLETKWGIGLGVSTQNLIFPPFVPKFCNLFYGLLLIRSMQVSCLKIATDSLEVINMLHSKNPPNNSLITSWKDLLHNPKNPKMRHEQCQANEVADRLAKEGLNLLDDQLFVIWSNPPPGVKNFLEDATITIYFIRPVVPSLILSMSLIW